VTISAPFAAGSVSLPAPIRALGWALCACALGCVAAGSEPVPKGMAVMMPPIPGELRNFQELGSVLYIAAHPDDENTQLITYLARGRNYRTAYMSLTRGDGGQNVIGPEFGDLLGVIRTQELLAARTVDGGQQFFSRARDFGYSKDYKDTLTRWDHQQVLSDIVRVIRTFRPDIIITRFPPEPSGTHGHHTASSALAIEAFKLAGDPTAFPEQLKTLTPWQPKRILWNNYGAYPGAPAATADANELKITIDGTDPKTGASFAVLAAKSRSMHRTQGFANFSVAAGGSGPRVESFQLLGGEPAGKDIMDGVDTTWGRFPGGAEIGRLAGEAIDHFDAADPAACVPALLDLKARMAALAADPVVEEKRRNLDWILQFCLGLKVSTTVENNEVVPGEKVTFHRTIVSSSATPVRWVGTRFPGIAQDTEGAVDLVPGKTFAGDNTVTLPATIAISQPYWLREEGTPGMFRVEDPALIGRPENPPAVPIVDQFIVGGQLLEVPHEAYKLVGLMNAPLNRSTRRMEVIPPVYLTLSNNVQLFAPGSTGEVVVVVDPNRAGMSGTVALGAPSGWTVSPASQSFHLDGVGDRRPFTFTVTAPGSSSIGILSARATLGGATYGNERIEINYPYIPHLLLQPQTRLKAVCLDLAIRGKAIGYLPGAGDSVAASLAQMGYAVTQLTDADLTPDTLKRFDAVVIGIRAFNTRKELPAHLPGLFAYVEAGGTVVDQYNTPGSLQTTQLGPYELKLNRDLPHYRVINEKGPVTLLDPGHPAFTTPNTIVPADFDGWVQERGLDFASEWDTAHWESLISCSDVGEAPLKGGLLVAHYGKGVFVYTGLSFFRQLPAGVPGAYRLFANLVSLGK
jgi:LmbE family N-acetylglucosaminyl deacetylase